MVRQKLLCTPCRSIPELDRTLRARDSPRGRSPLRLMPFWRWLELFFSSGEHVSGSELNLPLSRKSENAAKRMSVPVLWP